MSAEMQNNSLIQRPLINKTLSRRWAMVRLSFRILSCSMLCCVLFATAAVSASWAERLAVAVPIANIRSGPGTHYDILWKVEKYHPLTIVKKTSKWCRIKDFEADQGWISRSLLKKIPAVVLKKDNCNIRSGPGTQFDVVFTAEKGIPFKVLKRKKDWIHVQHADGDKGWVYGKLIW
jgi:uncharacterized protein YgiM (DUF1202 family)